MHPSVQGRPGDLARVLALEEKGLGLAILEAEDLAVTTDVKLALYIPLATVPPIAPAHPSRHVSVSLQRGRGFRHLAEDGLWERDGGTHLARVDLLTAEGVVVGTHVGGVGAIPVLLVVGLSSRAGQEVQNGDASCVRVASR